MKRVEIAPRDDWQQKVEGIGLHYHTVDGVPYWDESAYYEFTEGGVDQVEKATYELNQLCLKAVDFVVSDDVMLAKFGIPKEFHSFIRNSWENDEHTIYGRFDLVYDGVYAPKMLEYNADTPTGLVEAAVAQWYWLQDRFPNRNQFNSIHERLIEAWKILNDHRVRTGRGSPMYFAALEGSVEDYMNVNYLRDTAIQAGWITEYINVEDIGWNGTAFTDLQERPIENCFKLYPWEWMQREQFGPHVLRAETRWLEAPWKAVLSNKAILPTLWDLFPDHPNLLRASFEPFSSGTYVQKPIFSREGANIQIFEHGKLYLKTDGPYDGPSVYQQLWELPNFNGNRPCVGSWMVNGWACGIGIREDKSAITGNLSRFVPHLFGSKKKYSG